MSAAERRELGAGWFREQRPGRLPELVWFGTPGAAEHASKWWPELAPALRLSAIADPAGAWRLLLELGEGDPAEDSDEAFSGGFVSASATLPLEALGTLVKGIAFVADWIKDAPPLQREAKS